MDRAVPDAYGWADVAVPPFCPKTPDEGRALDQLQDAIIDRLFVLNAERADQEKRLAGARPAKPIRSRGAKPKAGQATLFTDGNE